PDAGVSSPLPPQAERPATPSATHNHGAKDTLFFMRLLQIDERQILEEPPLTGYPTKVGLHSLPG
ncbi:MAG: hypothetical protein KDF67_20175, partial [Ottowia sp.]|nr:hypothetical protein [Ottowia sp.]